MEVSGSASQINSAIQVALQKQVLDQMKVQGTELNTLLASTPAGSANSPGQGTLVDAYA